MSNPEYQSIGALSPEAEAVSGRQAGWDGLAGTPPAPVPPIEERQSAGFSRWNLRGNSQLLAAGGDATHATGFCAPRDVPPLAGYGRGNGAYDQPPAAAIDPAPFSAVSAGTDGRT